MTRACEQTEITRRSLLQLASAAMCAGALGEQAHATRLLAAEAQPIAKPPIGKVVWVGEGQTTESVISEVSQLGLAVCQIGFDDPSPARAHEIRVASAKHGVTVTAINEHSPGRRIFDFYGGPMTIGIIPPATRTERIAALRNAANLAHAAGVPAIHTHCGFIPEDPNQPLYAEAVAAVREIALYCKSLRLDFLCETGQETPITLVRLIDDVATGNVHVNLDVANLILYGKGNPVDAMEVFGSRVRGVHAKDGFFPTSTRTLGREAAIGEGKVDYPTLFRQLRAISYSGPIHLEREVGDERQRRADNLQAKAFLSKLIAVNYGS